MKTEERMRMASIIASVSAIVFAIPHFWFWLGVSLAYPGDFQETSGDSVLLVVGGLAVVAAVYPIVLTQYSWVRRLPEFVAALPAWGGSIGFTIWGLAYYGLQVQLAFNNDVLSEQYLASETNPNAIWGLFWYSLFIIWGLSLGMVAFYFHKNKKSKGSATGRGSEEEREPSAAQSAERK